MSTRTRVTKPLHMPDDFDRDMMQRAIRLARRGQGFVEPNPMVGCVIFKNGKIVAEGYHRRFGQAHAEANALRTCGAAARGSTVYVTLEPCCAHEGKKTPPCVDALIKAGVKRVLIGTLDPNPEVHGRSVRRLRGAGIEVAVLENPDTRTLIAPFRRFVIDQRPYVIAKWAQSLDAKLATKTGDSQWISTEESRHKVHELRARMDAILVGIGTVLRDDPLLTARNVRVRRIATRIILDADLRIPINSQLVRTAAQYPLIVFSTIKSAESPKAHRLRRLGIEIIGCHEVLRARPSRTESKTQLSLKDVLRELRSRSVTNLLVEGGPTVLASFFNAKLVDEALVFVAPILLGGPDSCNEIILQGANSVATAIKPECCNTSKSSVDTLYQLRFR